MINKKLFFFVVIFVIYLFLLKGYLNLILATIIFAYFTEVFIESFSNLKEKSLGFLSKQKFLNNRTFFIVEFIKRLKINVLFIYVFYLVFFILFIFFVFIPVVNQMVLVIKDGVNKLPTVIENLKNLFNSISYKYSLDISKFWMELGKWLETILNMVIKFLGNILANMGDWVVLVFVPILGLYFIESKKDFLEWIQSNIKNELAQFFLFFDNYQKIYIKAILINIFSIILLSCVIFSLFLGFQGILFGIIYGLFSFIPVIGPIIGSLPVIIVAFGKSVYLGFVFIFLALIIQQISDNFITPKITQKLLVIKPFFTIISILAFYSVFGFWSVFLAVPLSLTLKSILDSINDK